MEDLEEWPNCEVADCEYKACLALNSSKCYAHTLGRNPVMSFSEYAEGDCDSLGNTQCYA